MIKIASKICFFAQIIFCWNRLKLFLRHPKFWFWLKVCVQAIAFSPTEQYLATLGGQDDNAIVVWNLETGEPICGCPAFTETANFVHFFKGDDLQLISGGAEHLRIWKLDVANRKLRPTEVKTGWKKKFNQDSKWSKSNQNSWFWLKFLPKSSKIKIKLQIFSY